jgi:hypothetical protein
MGTPDSRRLSMSRKFQGPNHTVVRASQDSGSKHDLYTERIFHRKRERWIEPVMSQEGLYKIATSLKDEAFQTVRCVEYRDSTHVSLWGMTICGMVKKTVSQTLLQRAGAGFRGEIGETRWQGQESNTVRTKERPKDPRSNGVELTCQLVSGSPEICMRKIVRRGRGKLERSGGPGKFSLWRGPRANCTVRRSPLKSVPSVSSRVRN